MSQEQVLVVPLHLLPRAAHPTGDPLTSWAPPSHGWAQSSPPAQLLQGLNLLIELFTTRGALQYVLQQQIQEIQGKCGDCQAWERCIGNTQRVQIPNAVEMRFWVFFPFPTDALFSILFAVFQQKFCLFLYVEMKVSVCPVPETLAIFLEILDFQDKAPVPRFPFRQTARENTQSVLQ